MFIGYLLALTSAAATFMALPASAQSPEFRSGDLPGMTIHRAAEEMHRSDTVELVLAPMGQPGSRLEYKVHMQAGHVLLYSLTASAPMVSEFHGESDANNAVMFYREEAEATESYGQFLAPMTGIQGWYIANEQDVPVTVRLTLGGYYTLTPGRIELRPRTE